MMMKNIASWNNLALISTCFLPDTEKKKEMHVLSLDGGGSKGIMESIMLGHIMNLATIMTNNPEDILYSFDESLKIVRDRDILGPLKCGILDKISDHKKLGREPIHPTDAFQYIVGKFSK